MRRRSLSHRAATALLWVWFAAFFATPATWRPCPMHVAGENAPAHEAASSHGAHGAHDIGTAAPQGTAPAEQTPAHPCDCATDCCGAPAIVIAESEVRIVAAAILLVDAPVPVTATGVASARVRLLPFANAPPAA